MIIPLIIFIVSIFLVSKSSDEIVTRAVRIADILKINTMLIGIFLVALSTSLPELSIAIMSGVNNASAVSLGDILGSNIANIGLAIGLGIIFAKDVVLKKRHKREIKIPTIFTLIAVVMVLINIVYNHQMNFLFSIIAFSLFILYAKRAFQVKRSKDNPKTITISKSIVKDMIIFFMAAIILVISAHYAVEQAITIAGIFGLAQSFIGATIIAVGTSLPEISVNIKAFRKKEYKLAIGNALGSCVMNITLVLGVLTLISPIMFDKIMTPLLVIFNLIMLLSFLLLLKLDKIKKRHGMILFTIYIIFLLIIFALQYLEHFFV